MRSLTMKLVLAFLLTSVVGILLASLLIRAWVARDLDDYVRDQQRAAFVSTAAAYYAANDSWMGLDRWLRAQGGRRDIKPGPGGEPGPTGPPRPLPFVLVDATGVVVISFEPRYRVGQRVEAGELVRGTPVLVDSQAVGTVLTSERPSFLSLAEERYLARTDGALVVAGLASVAIAVALGVVLARLITRPARELTAAAQRIASGDLQQRVPVRSRDELGLLAAQFNQMSADLARATTLRRQMTADIAHDLRTPLTVVSGYLEALRDRVLPPTPERFTTLYAETQLLLRLVEDLHTLSLADAGELPLQPQSVAPRSFLERIADAYRHTAEQQGVRLAVQTEASVPALRVDPEHLARVLGNLVSNALRHTPRGGQVTLSARPGPSGAQVIVADTGEGIAPEHLANVFERFYRADQARNQENGGSGLGLAIVRSLVEAQGGAVAVTSTPGQGTAFTITLPAG